MTRDEALAPCSRHSWRAGGWWRRRGTYIDGGRAIGHRLVEAEWRTP